MNWTGVMFKYTTWDRAHRPGCDPDCGGVFEGWESIEGGEHTRWMTEECECPCHGPTEEPTPITPAQPTWKCPRCHAYEVELLAGTEDAACANCGWTTEAP